MKWWGLFCSSWRSTGRARRRRRRSRRSRRARRREGGAERRAQRSPGTRGARIFRVMRPRPFVTCGEGPARARRVRREARPAVRAVENDHARLERRSSDDGGQRERHCALSDAGDGDAIARLPALTRVREVRLGRWRLHRDGRARAERERERRQRGVDVRLRSAQAVHAALGGVARILHRLEPGSPRRRPRRWSVGTGA